MVIVGYNHGGYITGALSSAAGQTLPPECVIVVDDASIDDSGNITINWLAENELIWELDFHPVSRRLCRGLDQVMTTISTLFYTYVSADDQMCPDRLEKQVRRWEMGSTPITPHRSKSGTTPRSKSKSRILSTIALTRAGRDAA